MKYKVFGFLLALLLLVPMLLLPVQAAEEQPTFDFNLSIDGSDAKEVDTGDVITVVLKLKRTDAAQPYTMYAMQDEIRYDSTFFELVEGSAMLGDNISTTDIAMVDRYREFYMNFLSMKGGETWDADTLIGSFQLRVTGESGVTHITNEDYLVSFKDGSGSYDSTANTLTIILSTECIVRFHIGGGSEIPDAVVQYGEKLLLPEPPKREGYELEGWYTDINLTDKWDFENDIVQGNMSLYAKWKVAELTEPGFPWWIIVVVLVLLGAGGFLAYRKTRK